MKTKLTSIIAAIALTLSLNADPIRLAPVTPVTPETIQLAPVVITAAQSVILTAKINAALIEADVLLLPAGMGFDQIRGMTRVPITSGSNAGGRIIRISVVNPAFSGTSQ